MDQELEKMKVRKQKIQEDEQNDALMEIDAEFEDKNERLMEQKKLLASQNRKITII